VFVCRYCIVLAERVPFGLMENTIAVRVSDETYARLREMAKAEELRVSDIVRRVLRESLKVSA